VLVDNPIALHDPADVGMTEPDPLAHQEHVERTLLHAEGENLQLRQELAKREEVVGRLQ
jgi:hypothetical protein